MAKRSAGLLMYRHTGAEVEVLLGHPGGPFFARKDEGVWSLPKGLVENGEDDLAAARREFAEETGMSPGDGPFAPLGDVRLAGGKVVVAFAFGGDVDPTSLRSNDFEMEWPPRSGRRQRFPEIDRFGFFELAAARVKVHQAQATFLGRLQRLLED